jgi:imidazolonepropionase-like amidohydrolase
MARQLITADRLFDGRGGPAHLRPSIQVYDGLIQAIDHESDSNQYDEGSRRHFPGCTVLPGLIDTHVHLLFSAVDTNEAIIEQVGRESDEELLNRGLANAAAASRSGLTTVRDCGGKGRIVQGIRDRIRRREADGPDILSCGAPITTRRGHCHWLGLTADTGAEVQLAAERMLDEGADFLKVMATGGNMTAGSEPMRAQYPPEILKLIADIGRKAKKHTAAHVLSRAALPAAVAANIRTIEHCDWRVEEYRYEFDPTLARRMIEQEQFAGLTMSGITRRAFLPQVSKMSWGPVRRLDMRFACERKMIDFGVRFTLHTDAGVQLTPIDRFALGLRAAVVELKLTPSEALVAATGTAAEALGLNDRGVLMAGKRADLLVVRGNPLEDLVCLEHVEAVMKAGRWLS